MTARSPGRWLALVHELAPGLLFALAFALYAHRLEVPPRYIFDEVYHSYTAGQYAAGNTDAYVWHTKPPRKGVGYTWNHPPLGVHLISWGVYLWGDNSYGWRFMSAVFGAAGIAIAFALGRALGGSLAVGWLAAALLLMESLYLVQSRTGMLDIFGTVFMMAAFLALHRALSAPAGRARTPLIATGALLGLAMSTKWNAVHPSALVGLWVLVRTVRLGRAARRAPGDAEARRGFTAHLQGLVLGFLVAPVVIYLAVHIPFFVTGHSFRDFLELQRQTFVYHAKLHATHKYQSAWWQWPLTLRPVWYHVDRGGGMVAHIYANGTPLLAWALVPSVLAAAALAWRRRQMAILAVLLIGFFGQWLPWALVPRIAFAYHFLPATTIGVMAVALVLAELAGRGGVLRALAVAYVVAVLAAAAYFHPIRTAVPLSGEAFQARMWIRSWR